MVRSICRDCAADGEESVSQELDGRVAIITGAGRNIGRMIALQLADAGAAVVVNARSNRVEADAVVKEIEARGGRALAALGDVIDAAAMQAMAKAAVATFGRIDILVNNAAARAETPLTEMTFEQWRHVLGVSLDGAFICVKACMPHLKASGAGAVINIGGLSGHTGGKHRIHVVTAKAGLVGFTRALAQDLSEDKVTVNLVVPGLIARPREAGEPHHHSKVATLTGTRGKPEDVASMVRYLAGPAARYITGQTIHVNGGAYLG
jgi:3-oxoacyl-[acyl-carrier protein] reductase